MVPEDKGDEGQGGEAASLDGSPLQAHQPNHEQLEDQHRHYDLVKSLPPNLHIPRRRLSMHMHQLCY